MKGKLAFALTIIVFLFLFPSGLTFAEGNIQDDLEEEVSESIDQMQLDEFESFVQGLNSGYFGGETLKDFLKKLTKGELSLSAEDVIKESLTLVFGGVVGALPFFLSIILIAVLFSLVFGMTQNFLNKQTVEIVYFVCFAAVISIIVTMIVKVIGDVKNAVESLTNLVNTLFPSLITLMTALGGAQTSALFKPQIALMCTLVINVVNAVVIPLFIASVVLCISGNLSSNVKLDKLQSTVRYVAKCVLSVTFGGFITYLTISGLVGAMSDSVSAKAAKYLVSSYVPILGGYLTQGFDLISASLSLIKNALGVSGILVVLTIILTPVFKLVALTVGLKLTAGIIEPIVDKRMSSFVNGVAECVRQLVGAMMGVGFVFIVSIALVIMTLNLL